LGQNFLRDRRIASEVAAVADTGLDGPIVELGAGGGALTAELVRLGRELVVVEADPYWVSRLRGRFGRDVRVVHADMLRFVFPRAHHDIVSSVPFGISTPLIRLLLTQRRWSTATLLVQWDVARKRATVRGGTMLTASWWPWFSFKLGSRVPARAFRPVPSVDAGVLCLERRRQPLLPWAERRAYQAFVRTAFQGGGVTLSQGVRGQFSKRSFRRWAYTERLSAQVTARDLEMRQWISAFLASRRAGGASG
jgi:23S rRNA (adenine-N6)-dimethyltransferase